MTRISRPWMALVAALVLSLVPANDAFAKKDKKSKGKEVPVNIELTGLTSFDDVFTKIADIDGRLDTAEKSLRTAKHDLNEALELKKGTPLKEAIADLQKKADGKVKVALNGKQPELQASEAVPQNVTDALAAVNGLTAAMVVSVDELAGIPKEVKQLQKKTVDFPSQLKAEILENPTTSIKDLPKTLKVLKANTTVTAGLPERSTKVSSRAVGILEVVGSTFPAGAAKQPAEGADESDTPTKTKDPSKLPSKKK